MLATWIFHTPPDPGHDIPAGLPAAAVMGDSVGAAPEPPHRSTRRNDVQGLRALAIGLVVLAHLGIVRLAGGFIGVDVFFVISGFLITGLMLRDFAHERRISLRAFYARRAQRILPAAILVTAAILVFIFAWNDLLLALSLTATKAAITAPVAIVNFSGSSQFEEPTGSIAAGAVVITVPIIVFVLIFQRRIVAGLTSGAVKG